MLIVDFICLNTIDVLSVMKFKVSEPQVVGILCYELFLPLVWITLSQLTVLTFADEN